MRLYPVKDLLLDKFNPLERTNLELSGGSRPRLVLQYKTTRKRVLIKSYSHNPHEIYSEYLASRLAKVSGIPAQSAAFRKIPPHIARWLKEEAGDAIGDDWHPVAIEVANIFPDHIQVVYGKDILGNPERRTTLTLVEESLRVRYGDFEDLIQAYIDMVVFDAFIGNMDRHHENWGVCITKEFRERALQTTPMDSTDIRKHRYFTPLFDHGSSLMFELPESKLKTMLEEPDRMAHYANRKYGFILTPDGKRGNVFDILHGYSKISDDWNRRIKIATSKIVSSEFIDYANVVERMPIEDELGWTEARKNVIVRCLGIRYNNIQQLS